MTDPWQPPPAHPVQPPLRGHVPPHGPPPPYYGPPPFVPPPPKRPNTGLIFTIVIAVVVLVAAGIGGVVWLTSDGADEPTLSATPKNATPDYGLVFGASGKDKTVEVYLDFLCPACKTWHETNGRVLKQAIADSTIKAVLHPLAILDRMSSSEYSTRAAAAAVCAADEDRWFDYTDALWANQPPESAEHPGDPALISIGEQIGLGDAFATCVSEGRFLDWVRTGTEKAAIPAVPTVLVNGAEQPLGSDLAAALN
ncbi:hypothetical protein Afil01_11020 [Actinorhabdospora filicis]|uniref:Thioredoxin-like fold domain-containing protein n=1 Tax=Actinorhabdospora filicis TaxID=1785913 RepID=A0A9W6W939_9ACTN|nr:thioredoxin domain-containing protein [Actinorhabdospora filicis]GLZ76295.1 hypothetical protein Afil01_11020 [Actinorhabdospora filicis]